MPSWPLTGPDSYLYSRGIEAINIISEGLIFLIFDTDKGVRVLALLVTIDKVGDEHSIELIEGTKCV